MLTPEVIKDVIAHLESELAKLPEEKEQDSKKEEPKLRHGDYGLCKVWKRNTLCGFVYDETMGNDIYVFEIGNKSSHIGFCRDIEIISIDGNFDDLAALQEDVERFEVNDMLSALGLKK